MVADLRPDRPGAVPVQVEGAAAGTEIAAAFFGDLRVVLDAGRVRAEHEAVLPVEEAVNDDDKCVGVVETRIAPAVGDNNARRIIVMCNNADIKGGIGVADEHLGFLRRRHR